MLARRKGPTEEELKKQQETVKQNEKIKGVNAKLAEVRDLEKAGNYDQAITVMQEVTTADAYEGPAVGLPRRSVYRR